GRGGRVRGPGEVDDEGTGRIDGPRPPIGGLGAAAGRGGEHVEVVVAGGDDDGVRRGAGHLRAVVERAGGDARRVAVAGEGERGLLVGGERGRAVDDRDRDRRGRAGGPGVVGGGI